MKKITYPQLWGSPWIFTYPGAPMTNVPTDPDNPSYISQYNIWLDTTNSPRVDWWICTDGGDYQNSGLSWQFLFTQAAPSSYVDQSSLGFNVSRQPDSVHNTFAIINVVLTNSATVAIQISPDGISFSTISTLDSNTYSGSFIVPAGCYYQLVTTGSGVQDLVSLSEISL